MTRNQRRKSEVSTLKNHPSPKTNRIVVSVTALIASGVILLGIQKPTIVTALLSATRNNTSASTPTYSAQIDRRSRTPIRLAARGSIGAFSDYYERFGLRYYRDQYPGTECFDDFIFGLACTVDGEFHARDVYFPNPALAWI